MQINPDKIPISSLLKAMKDNVDRVNCKPISYPVNENIRHAILNMSDESCEMLGVIKDKMYYNRPISVLNLIEELGDTLWGYNLAVEELSSILHIPFEELFVLIFLANQAKLKARYVGEGFTKTEANNRNKDFEYKCMLEVFGEYSKIIKETNL